MKLFFFILSMLFSAAAQAVNPVALWMPASLQQLMPQLTKAAEMAEATERCDKVMSGRHSSRRSTPERPVFSIVCRDAQTKRTYSILYAVENGEVVEFNEQQPVTGEAGQPVARPWEDPALKPVANPGMPVVNEQMPVASPAAPPAAVAPGAASAPAPVEPPAPTVDPRLAKLMARLEAAGVKGASAEAMKQDMQKKTLQESLDNYEQQSAAPTVPASAAARSVPAAVPSLPAATASTATTATTINGTPASSTNGAAASTAPAAANTSVAEGVSAAIAAQLWAQCLPAIKTKTASMIERVLDEKTIPPGYPADGGATRMDVPFEAKNPEGMNLRFTAVCTVDAAGTASVRLRPRREE